jgi:hypothetical protein
MRDALRAIAGGWENAEDDVHRGCVEEGAYTIQRESKAGREETDAMMGALYEMLLGLDRY